MAYSNYGALVYMNGERRQDKEDCALFESSKIESWANYCHGVMGDGKIRVRCYKQYIPEIFELQEDGTEKQIEFDYGDEEFDFNVDFEYNRYKFHFESGEPCTAEMIEPDGTKWECNYDYMYGAGWND